MAEKCKRLGCTGLFIHLNGLQETNEAARIRELDICFNEDARLNETEFTQPAILTMSIAVLELMKEKGLKADYTAGLSLGEYSALVASGVLDFEQAVCLVRKRGRFMTEAVPSGEGGMCAVLNLDAEKIQEMRDYIAGIAAMVESGEIEPARIDDAVTRILTLKEKYGLLEFPKTYLPKEYDYLICDVGDSFDAKGEDVMSHGGISIDECVVPFIKIKAVENNG